MAPRKPRLIVKSNTSSSSENALSSILRILGNPRWMARRSSYFRLQRPTFGLSTLTKRNEQNTYRRACLKIWGWHSWEENNSSSHLKNVASQRPTFRGVRFGGANGMSTPKIQLHAPFVTVFSYLSGITKKCMGHCCKIKITKTVQKVAKNPFDRSNLPRRRFSMSDHHKALTRKCINDFACALDFIWKRLCCKALKK